MSGITKQSLSRFQPSFEEEQRLLRIQRYYQGKPPYEKSRIPFTERIRRALLDAFRFRGEAEQEED
ncbi:hypothetical protein JW752_02975 [Candidatus Peregrinibacteria bacterium]|nr:hypothetical protein [Candidatus Peregrinibacteria bacterium]